MKLSERIEAQVEAAEARYALRATMNTFGNLFGSFESKHQKQLENRAALDADLAGIARVGRFDPAAGRYHWEQQLDALADMREWSIWPDGVERRFV